MLRLPPLTYAQLQQRALSSAGLGKMPRLCQCDAISIPTTYSLTTLWKPPGAANAGIHGIPDSVSRQEGRRVLRGSQLPAPHQRPRDPVQTIVLPDGSRGTEFLQKQLRPKPGWWEPKLP